MINLQQLSDRFNYLNYDATIEDNFRLIAKKRGYLTKGGEDIEKLLKK